MALYQFLGFLVTAAIASLSGVFTGFIMRISWWNKLQVIDYFNDEKNWEMQNDDKLTLL